MTDRNSLRDLEERHDEARTAVRRRIETADERLMHYRSQMNAMRETFHGVAVQRGVADDPGFRLAFEQVSHDYDEHIREGVRVLGELQDEYDALTREQQNEREGLS
ncbi:hypothetical protein [Leifsonia sp. C5G2]|uniref:hypothetical protein n=1 Tax=Leifsonia sp. C5G2 TaxID=2735269 RepID=UPI0015857739|nr:hypothetical protein [Leifsonia sp. C5G2]NUU05096.1 hypothetical protein [Leifsonia sp. C5G2]